MLQKGAYLLFYTILLACQCFYYLQDLRSRRFSGGLEGERPPRIHSWAARRRLCGQRAAQGEISGRRRLLEPLHCVSPVTRFVGNNYLMTENHSRTLLVTGASGHLGRRVI